MLHRRDPIFWAASAIFALGLALAGVDNAFLLLLVAAYLLRPTLHSLGYFRRLVDERQLQIQYRASNVAFATMVVGVIVVMIVLMRRDDHTWEMLSAVLMATLAVRALAALLMVGDPATAGRRMIVSVGLLLALFGAIEGASEPGAIVAHVLPGGAIAGLGLAARRHPRLVAITALVVAALGTVLVAPGVIARGVLAGWGTLLAIALIAIPLVVAAVCLLRAQARDPDGGSGRAGTEAASTGSTAIALLLALALPPGAAAQPPENDTRFACKARSNVAGGTDCRLLRPDTVYGRPMPAGVVLHYDGAGVYVFFSFYRPERFEGLDLAGATSGITQEVYPDGAPRALWLRAPQEVSGVPCRAFSILGELFKRASRVQFHPAGQFRSCRLSRDATIQGRAFSRGALVELAADGRLVVAAPQSPGPRSPPAVFLGRHRPEEHVRREVTRYCSRPPG